MTHSKIVANYYNNETESFYRALWDEEDMHLGLFDKDEDEKNLKNALKRMTESILSNVKIRTNDFVIDAGCGVGGTAFYLHENFGCRVFGLNISEKQLETARLLAARKGFSHNINFEIADLSKKIPCVDECSDCIISIESACHYSNRINFANECFRVLKPGGIFTGSDWMTVENLTNIQKITINEMENAWFLKKLETEKKYIKILKKAGFKNIVFEDCGERLKENAMIMFRSYLTLKTREKEGIEDDENLKLWKNQLLSLALAWNCGSFKVKRFYARK